MKTAHGSRVPLTVGRRIQSGTEAREIGGIEPTDERRAALFDMMVEGQAPSTGPIRLVAHDPGWAAMFDEERSRIDSALGPTARGVEHVGSTAVPGLVAKPIIDILLVVPDSSDEARYVPHLQRASYILRIRERDWYEHRLLRGTIIRSNVHVFSEGCAEIDRMLRFRDRLRSHATIATSTLRGSARSRLASGPSCRITPRRRVEWSRRS